MKKLMLTLVSVLLFAASSMAQGVIAFETEKHDFGKISEGPIATYNFEFKNNGTAPVVISGARASCGCTTPEWPKDPIMPGATGNIKVGYTTKGRVGNFNKTITVTSNAENGTVVLTINGIVLKKE